MFLSPKHNRLDKIYLSWPSTFLPPVPEIFSIYHPVPCHTIILSRWPDLKEGIAQDDENETSYLVPIIDLSWSQKNPSPCPSWTPILLLTIIDLS